MKRTRRWPKASDTCVRLKAADWKDLYDACLCAAAAADQRAALRGAAGLPKTRIKEAEAEAERFRDLASRLGHNAEVAAHAGIRTARGGTRPTGPSPARDYLDLSRAEEIAELRYRPRPGFAIADSSPGFAAQRFLDHCDRTMIRPDAFNLHAYLTGTLGWTVRHAAPAAAG